MQAHDSDWLDALHLASASLPIGGFAYSQGLEQACQLGDVHDAQSAQTWIEDYLLLVLARQEMPWWIAVYRASLKRDWPAVRDATNTLCALRETAELRLESRQMGHAFVRLYDQWFGHGTEACAVDSRTMASELALVLQTDYTAAHGALCGLRQMPITLALTAWLWSWLDNQVLAAVKLVPLGQRDGQRVLHAIKPKISQAVEIALATPMSHAGSAPIGLAMASTQHETQYARLFRS